MKTSVVLPAGYFSRMHNYLFDGSRNEYGCYLFCGVAGSKNRFKLLGRRLELPDKGQDYELNTPVACKPNLHFINNVLFEAPRENDLIRKNLSIVDIHSHPFAGGETVGFSSTDDQWQKESVEYFFNIRKYTGYHCFIVFGEKSFCGRVWYRNKRRNGFRYYPLDEIVILDYPYRKWETCKKKRRIFLSKAQTTMLDRQILAFGKEGQKVMSNITAGIVGVGGIGSIAAEGLARLGVSRFVLVDHDHAEITNLNRFLGMTHADALSGMLKTAISTREIRAINPRAKVASVNTTVYESKALEKLKMVDFIVLGTDNLLSRAFTNEFCLQYCIPLFSVGTIINADPGTGRLQDIFGEYQVVIPGIRSCCLNCSGAVDYHEVSYLLSSREVREEGEARGYINLPGFNQPAVLPLNGAMTQMAMSEIHNYFCGFKEALMEGFGYDQKRNRLYPKYFLNKVLDECVDGAFLEGFVRDEGVELRIDGAGPFSVHKEKDINILCEEKKLNYTQAAAVLDYIETRREDAIRKESCPFCGKQGIIGRGNNEPLTDYT